tara:strand:- start:26585 stop:28240 length:1656 start_codon:yes stop_codon:yes gene_type:complete
MSNKKKRLLILSESHHLASGFGTYAKEIISRLQDTGKYEIAEFASWGRKDQIGEVPWIYYGNLPEDNNQQEGEIYGSNPANNFGIWRFDRVVMDFKPDVVLTYRDPWMDQWIADSPLRKFFHWIWMPTVDSAPQKREWLEVFQKCDAVFTYSEFGTKTLNEATQSNINVVGCASPGINPKVFKPAKDKQGLRESLGLQKDCFIIGTVMRNQRRKLFIELMKSFKTFLENGPKEITDKTFLYLHTSYPEKQGWDIGGAAIELGIAHKVICTYICRSCNRWFPSKFKDAICTCKYCGNRTSFMPNVSSGLEVPDLVKVYNLFDLYVQYAICEGFGMPQVEAAACGIPVAATNYSAMEDVVRHTKGFPIAIDKLFREADTGADRVYPSNDNLIEVFNLFFTSSDKFRKQKSEEARKGAITRYNWEDTALVWEKYIDSYSPVDLQGKWESPPFYKRTISKEEIPQQVGHSDFVRWLYSMVLQEPEGMFSFEACNFISSLNMGADIINGMEPMSREKIVDIFQHRVIRHNELEKARTLGTDYGTAYFKKEASQSEK